MIVKRIVLLSPSLGNLIAAVYMCVCGGGGARRMQYMIIMKQKYILPANDSGNFLSYTAVG